jgi:hypothetical protein
MLGGDSLGMAGNFPLAQLGGEGGRFVIEEAALPPEYGQKWRP